MRKFTPFSKNIIFCDTEFSDLDIYSGEILSIGLIKYSGEELYLELEHSGKTSDWMKENLPELLISKNTIRREDAKIKIREFIGDTMPYLVAHVNQYDMAFWHKLFYGEEEPIHWLPIDFASMLFACGINPEKGEDAEKKLEFYARLGIDHEKLRPHHALDDARLLREMFLALEKKSLLKFFRKELL